jgi:hypothetical protein
LPFASLLEGDLAGRQLPVKRAARLAMSNFSMHDDRSIQQLLAGRDSRLRD